MCIGIAGFYIELDIKAHMTFLKIHVVVQRQTLHLNGNDLPKIMVTC